MLGYIVIVLLTVSFTNNTDPNDKFGKQYITNSALMCAEGANYLRDAATANGYTMTDARCDAVYYDEATETFRVRPDEGSDEQ